MKIHEKARLYDELLKDYEDLIKQIENHHDSIDIIENEEDMVRLKESSHSNYYSMLSGKLKGSNFGLSIIIGKAKGTLNWYKA
jgi:hypothetical protein